MNYIDMTGIQLMTRLKSLGLVSENVHQCARCDEIAHFVWVPINAGGLWAKYARSWICCGCNSELEEQTDNRLRA